MFQDEYNENFSNESTYDNNSDEYTNSGETNTEKVHDGITGNSEEFATLLENYLPTPENTDKLKKPLPQWFYSAAVSFAVCAVLMIIHSVFIIPHIKPSAVISYHDFENTPAESENNSHFSIAAEKLKPSIVTVSGESAYRSFFGVSTQTVSGSGIIISDNGYILTSCTLIGSDGNATVSFNQNNYEAKVISQDPTKDIAILQINAEGLSPAPLGNSDNIHIGDSVIAISNILGGDMGTSVTRGVICGINNGITTQSGNTLNLLQTDAITDSGSTGGCIVNTSGDVIGMITNAVSASSEKISFAIPSNDIMSISGNLSLPGHSASAGLIIGITGSDADHGVTVESVADNSPAKQSGVEVGDLILKVDGKPVKSVSEINAIRDTHKKGETIVLTVYRGGEITDINIIL